jgi:hypothetical protein
MLIDWVLCRLTGLALVPPWQLSKPIGARRFGIMRAEADQAGCTGYGPGVLPGETTAACFVIAVANSTAAEELRANANWPGIR